MVHPSRMAQVAHQATRAADRRREAGGVHVQPRTTTPESPMKVKTNLRAGAGAKQNSKSINNTVVTYIPAISRCVGI